MDFAICSRAIFAVLFVATPTALKTSCELNFERTAKSEGEYILSTSNPNRAIIIYDTLSFTKFKYKELASSVGKDFISLPNPTFIKSETYFSVLFLIMLETLSFITLSRLVIS